MSSPRRNLFWLTLFAIAMAHVEASLVIYLRNLYYPENPLSLFPIVPLSHRHLLIEIVRELATIVMLLSVSMLSARGPIRVFASFVYLFGTWDLLYYLWLKLMIGWPVDWLEWDVLFLLPWPWLAPWITAASIAMLFSIWGGWVLLATPRMGFTRTALALFSAGALLALAAFLLPALPLLPEGEEAMRNFVPNGFAWVLYLPGLLMMTAGLWHVARPRGEDPPLQGPDSPA